MTNKPNTPEEWEQYRKDRHQANLDAFNALQDDQQAAIRQTFKALEAAQNTLSECQDLWLSDIKELDRAFLANTSFTSGDRSGAAKHLCADPR